MISYNTLYTYTYIIYIYIYVYMYIDIQIYIYLHLYLYLNIYIYIYIYICNHEKIYPSSYLHKGFVATNVLGHMMYDSSCVQVHDLPQSFCGDNRQGILYIYIYIYIYIHNICIKYIMCIYKYKYILYIYYVITNKQMNSTHYYLAILILMLLHNLQAIQMLCYTPQAQTL